MRNRCSIALACLAGLAAPAVHAGECLVNGTPVSPQVLASVLEQGPTASLPGQLAGVPFSVVSHQSVSVYWASCGEDCLFNEFLGESQCGNLVESPIDSFVEAEYIGVPNPPAFAQVLAIQSANGKWEVGAQGFVSPTWDKPDGHAAYSFELGTRDVIDVTSGSAAELLPLAVQFRALGHLGIQICEGNLFHWIPLHSARIRVIEQSSSGTRTLVNEVYSQFFQRDLVFPVEVRPSSTLTVDVWFQASANAGPAQDGFGNYCAGAVAPLDFYGPPAWDGIQVSFVPDPALTLTPRSGILYEPLPEPESAAGIALLSLAVLRARRPGQRP
jgi:hypothetical protein